MSTSVINVRYSREKYGIIPRHLLEESIASHKIMQFYRESDKSWVNVGVDPVRNRNSPYVGYERKTDNDLYPSDNDSRQ